MSTKGNSLLFNYLTQIVIDAVGWQCDQMARIFVQLWGI